jgi:hypothetical protein
MAPLGRRAFLKLAAQSTALMAMTIKFPSLAFSGSLKDKKPKGKIRDFYVVKTSFDDTPSKEIIKEVSDRFKLACSDHDACSVNELKYEKKYRYGLDMNYHIWSAQLVG